MADKVQKIRKKVVWLQKRAEHNFDISLTENERQFWLGESNVLTLIGKYIDTMQEESHQELYNKLSNLRDDAFSNTTKESWEACLSEEPVSEELEEAADFYANTHTEWFDADNNPHVSPAFKAGAKWQKENLWKSADGNDLPEYEREVIALTHPYQNDEHLRVVFAHRPNKYAKVWNSDLGEEQVVEIERHGKGEWNIPNVKWWLDVKLPKEIEL